MNHRVWISWILLAGLCATASAQNEPLDYADSANWVLRPNVDEEPKAMDVFYVYPTVVADRENPLMSWTNETLRAKTIRIAKQQTGMFSNSANVVAPFVRQLEFYRAMDALRKVPPDYESMRVGADDVRAAFRYYLEHWNAGRPFVLLGHSQGAMDLFLAMKDDFGDASVASNFVAAYLIGMAIRPEDIAGFPHLRIARGEKDTGVIVTFNSESILAGPSPFSGPETYGINPLNWRTDGESASSSMNLGAVFFDENGNVSSEVPSFCGATMDSERGALIVEPPGLGPYDAPTLLGEGVYHMNDIYFFYRNLGENARTRAAAMTP